MLTILLALAAQTAPFPAEEAPKRMTLPPGFSATLFAGEPDLVQPMGFTFDDRGRLWVVENFSYPHWLPAGREGRDRVSIYEDANGDGRFDTKKVFHEKLANVSGIAWGHGGVWLTAVPYLLFVPDRNGDDVPDGPAEILLDGWDLKAKHNVLNKPAWGPDGWLYGLNGILSNSLVGKPGAPPEERVALNCGVWRYHPLRRVFEAVAHGTTNPWGIDWDERGQTFITNCVIKHAFHMIPGGHFERMFGEDKTAPNLYGLIPSPADHIHWAGGAWTDARGGEKHSAAGGGHAHVGAMIYLGDNWPAEYRGNLYTLNLHGHRMSRDALARKGSGYVVSHLPDFLLGHDTWFRGLDCQYGPDGGVFVSDWTDTGECHNYDKADMANGRLYKIVHGKPEPRAPRLGADPDADLVKAHDHANQWYVRHARRILQERAAAGKLDAGTVPALFDRLKRLASPRASLEALWTLHGIGVFNDTLALETLGNPDEDLRAWAVTLTLEDRAAPAEILARLAALAATDPSPAVRLALASGLQRLPVAERLPIGKALAARAEDASDDALPLLIWYGLEAVVAKDRSAGVQLLAATKIPRLREFLARRLAADTK